MRSPGYVEQDAVIESPTTEAGAPAMPSARRAGRRPADRPSHGKALERLRLFEAERELTDVTPDSAVSPLVSAAPGAEAVPPVVETLAAALAEMSTDSFAGAFGRSWTPLGPTVMQNGQTYGSGASSRVDVVGRVSAIAVDPSDGSHLLVGSGGGGIWESRNTGTTWAPRGDGLATLAIGALCFDPRSPSTAY